MQGISWRHVRGVCLSNKPTALLFPVIWIIFPSHHTPLKARLRLLPNSLFRNPWGLWAWQRHYDDHVIKAGFCRQRRKHVGGSLWSWFPVQRQAVPHRRQPAHRAQLHCVGGRAQCRAVHQNGGPRLQIHQCKLTMQAWLSLSERLCRPQFVRMRGSAMAQFPSMLWQKLACHLVWRESTCLWRWGEREFFSHIWAMHVV